MAKKTKSKAPKVDPFVEGLMGKLLDRLTALEKKVDVVISKVGNLKSVGQGGGQPQPHQPKPEAPQPPRRDRTLYEAICADCSKVCEVPFQPTENRPVYCKSCWAKRKGQAPGMPIIRPVSLPPKPAGKLGLPVPTLAPPAAEPKKTKKSAAAKKTKKRR